MAHKEIPEIAAADALDGLEQLHVVQGSNSRRVTVQEIADFVLAAVGPQTESFVVCLSDETTALIAGTAKVTMHWPYDFVVTSVSASAVTAPTGSALQVDINVGGVSMLSTKLTIDAGEKTSVTAAVPAVILNDEIPSDSEVTFDIDQIGSTIAGAGLKVTVIGYQP